VVAGLAIDAYSKWAEHCEMLESAHQTMAERISSAMQSASTSVISSQDRMATNAKRVLQEYDEYLEKCAESHRQLAEAADRTFGTNNTIEQYAEKISPLLKKVNEGVKLTDAEYAELRSSINGYNDVTGESINVTRDESGVVRVLKDNVALTVDEFNKLADAKRRANEQSYYDSEYQNKVNEHEEGAVELAKQRKALQEAADQYSYAMQKYEEAQTGSPDKDFWLEQAALAQGTINELVPKVTELAQKQNELNAEMRVSSQMASLLEKSTKSFDDMSAFEKLVATNGEIRAAFVAAKTGVYDFDSAIKASGVDMNVITADVEGLLGWLNSWDGSTKGLIDHLSGPGGLGIALSDVQKKAMILNGVKIGDKTFTVSDNGTISYGEQQLNELNQFELNGQTYTVEIDTANATASIKDAEGNVVDFSNSVSDIPEEAEVTVTANTEQAKADIQAIIDGDYSITVKVNTSGGPSFPTATGGMLPSARMIRHASGGYFVDRPTVIGRTGNVTHIAGEAGREFVSMNAKGGVVLPLTNPYMRPWVRAVADQMGGSVSTSVNITLAYGADASAKQMVYDIGREMRLQGLMRG